MKKLYLYILSIVISLIFGYPHIYGIAKYGSEYASLKSDPHISHISEETYTYAPQVNHFLKGYLRGDPYLWEYRSSPSPFVSELAAIIPIAILSIFFLSTSNGFIVSDLIFPTLLFLVIFLGLRNEVKNPYFRTAAALGVVITPFLSMVFPKISSYGTWLTGVENGPLFFTRTPHPQISTFYLFAFIFVTLWMLKKATALKATIWSITFSVSLFSSIFVSSTIVVGALLISPLIFKKIGSNNLLKTLPIIALFSIILLMNFFDYQQLFKNSDFLERFTFPKDFLFPAQIRYIVIAAFAWYFVKGNLTKTILALTLAASILTDFHQLIFARSIQPDHWLSRVLAPLATLSLFIIAQKFIDLRMPKIANRLWFLASIFIITLGLVTQINWTDTHKFYQKKDQSRDEIIKQIEKRTTKNDVIGTFSSDLSDEIAGITGRWLYVATGDRTPVSTDEELVRICDLVFLIKPQDQDQAINELVLYTLALATADQNKVNQSVFKVKVCLDSKPKAPRFKLDFIVKQDNLSNSWQLEPVK